MTRAIDFFANDTEPAVAAWLANEQDLRLAKVVAVSINHMADHYFHSYPVGDPKLLGASTVRALRTELRRREPAFALVNDVADAQKHVELDRGNRQITSTDQTSVRSLGYGEGAYGEGRYGGVPEVVVELDSGDKRHFSALVDATLAMWRGLL
jgi:hypothetical protein